MQLVKVLSTAAVLSHAVVAVPQNVEKRDALAPRTGSFLRSLLNRAPQESEEDNPDDDNDDDYNSYHHHHHHHHHHNSGAPTSFPAAYSTDFPLSTGAASSTLFSSFNTIAAPLSTSAASTTWPAYNSSSSPCPSDSTEVVIGVTANATSTTTIVVPASSSSLPTTSSYIGNASATFSSGGLNTSIPFSNTTSLPSFPSFSTTPAAVSSASPTPESSTSAPSSGPLSTSSEAPTSSIAALSTETSIFVSASPVAVNTESALHPSSTLAATTTITTTEPSSAPNPGAVLCGIHGLPVGDFFLAQYVEDRASEDVTLQGCYEFCVGSEEGCVSYDYFFLESTGAPRCDLYGGSVAQSLYDENPYVPHTWFDVACGQPYI